MSVYTYFTTEQYEGVSVLTWNASAVGTLLNGELGVELKAFVMTAKPRCVVVSFAQLTRCPTSLLNGLIVLHKQLDARGGRLVLCDVSGKLREQFDQLAPEVMLEIHDTLAEATAACQEDAARESS